MKNQVAEFKSGFAGMGSFSFLPATDRIYTAIVKCPGGSEKKIELASALTSGYVLSADNIKPDTLYATRDLLNKGNLTFIPLSNGAPLFTYRLNFLIRKLSLVFLKINYLEA